MDEEIDFVLDYDAKAPAPLDQHIASVYLQTPSNRYIDGYELQVSAAFGEEYISLRGENFSVEVQFSVKRASIDLQFKNCQPKTIFESSPLEYSHVETNITRENKGIQLGAKGAISTEKLGGNAGAEINGGYEVGTEASSIEEIKRDRLWEFRPPTTIRIKGNGKPLEGEVVSQIKGWVVQPDPNAEVSAVAALLTTRSSWINFGKLDETSATGTIGQKLKRWARGKRARDRALFDLLLAKLAERGLQAKGHVDATLAVHMLVLRKPETGNEFDAQVGSVASERAVRSIDVDTRIIEQFLSAKKEERIGILHQVGVSKEEINQSLELLNVETEKARLFIAGTAPLSALESLKFTLYRKDRVRSKIWDAHNKNRSRSDLVALGLIEVREGYVYPLVSRESSAEDALRHAATKAPMIQAAKLMLLEHPEITSLEIGRRLGEMFDRDYNSDASRIRVGGAIRRWAIWLEPHLVAPDAKGRTASLRVSATATETSRGAPSLATPENLARAQDALDKGMPAPEVAKLIGISRSGIYEWGKRGLLEISRRSKK